MIAGIDYPGVACVFFCHDGKGNLLLHKRSDKARDENGRWDCGGGKLEFGEDVESTITREILEEFNAKTLDLKFIGHSNVLREHQGKKTHWVALVYAALIDPKGVKINEPEKFDEMGWFTKDNLPEPLHSMWPRHFQYVLDAGVV